MNETPPRTWSIGQHAVMDRDARMLVGPKGPASIRTLRLFQGTIVTVCSEPFKRVGSELWEVAIVRQKDDPDLDIGCVPLIWLVPLA